MRRAGLAIAVIALTAAAPPAYATTSRDDYGVAVSAICSAANPQLEQLGAAFDQTKSGLLRHKVSDRKFSKLNRRVERLEIRMRVQYSAIFHSELDQLRQVAPAPGDEALVADWIATRESLLGIWDQNTGITKRILRLNQLSAKGRISLRALIRASNQINKQAMRLFDQYITLGGKDYDLGTQLGATPCVSLDFPSALV